MIDVDMDGTGQEVDQVRALDHQITEPKSTKFDNKLGWSFVKPSDNDYNGILLSDKEPTIDEVASKFAGCDFIIEDFGLNSPHAWRRMF